jgi:hypothetical protein
MILLFIATLPSTGQRAAVQLLETFRQFNPSLRPRKGGGGASGGGYYLSVPSGREPLRNMRRFQEHSPHYTWELLGVDDDGNPTIPLSEEAVTP